MRNREDRRKAIAQEAQGSRSEGGGGYAGPNYIIAEAEFAKLGIRKYNVDSGDKPDEGRTHSWSFLEPHAKDPCVVGLGLYIHYRIGVNEESFLCPRFMKKEFEKLRAAWPDIKIDIPEAIKHGRCPICEKRDINVNKYKAERESMSEDDRKAWHKTNIRDLEPFNGGFTEPKPNRYIAWIVDESEGGNRLDDGVQLVEFCTGGRNNAGVHKGLMDQAVDLETNEVLDILDPSKDGWKFSFNRKGKKQSDVSYSGHKLKPRREPLDQAWLDAVPRFTDVLVFADFGQIKDAYIGTPDAPPQESRRAEPADEPRRRSRADEAADDVGDELEDAMNDSPPAEEPRRRRSRSEGDEPNPTQPARGVENNTRAGQRTAPSPTDDDSPRRRRQAEEPPKDDEPSPEAIATAERIRNRQRRREE